MDDRQSNILKRLRHLARARSQVPLKVLRKQPGCSPATIKAAFSKEATQVGTSVYAFVYNLAGLTYSQHTARKPNEHWRVLETRLAAIKGLARDIAKRTDLTEIEGARVLTVSDFDQGGLSYLLKAYYRGSPELAVEAAFGIRRRARRGEFRSWLAVDAHLRQFLRGVDLETLTEKQLHDIVPGWHVISRVHGGFVRILEQSGLRPFNAFRHSAPSGYWNRREHRVRWIRDLVAMVRESTRDQAALPQYADFLKYGIGGLLATRKVTTTQLLREAGFEVPNRPDWTKQSNRKRRLHTILKLAGGHSAITFGMIVEEEPGLADWYATNLKRKDTGHPRLYEILKEAGITIHPGDAYRGLGGRRHCNSSHGHDNDSRWQAVLDEWIFELVGFRHQHNVPYPGQTDRSRPLDCDFVIPHPEDADPRQSLWIEFAGMTGARSLIGRQYATRLRRKQDLARQHDLTLVIIFPALIIADPERVRNEIAKAAPWLQGQVLRNTAAWRRICKMPSPDAFRFVMTKSKYTCAELERAIRARIVLWRQDPLKFPINVGFCQKSREFGPIYQACKRHFGISDAKSWAKLLVRAGLSPGDATLASRIRQEHDASSAGVLAELESIYRSAKRAGTWPGREPALNGALRLRAIRAWGSVASARAGAKKAISSVSGPAVNPGRPRSRTLPPEPQRKLPASRHQRQERIRAGNESS